jgi:hypothetical protein
MENENDGIGLTELLNQVKQELVAASTLATVKKSADGTIQPTDIPLFTYGNVELELQVTIKKEAGGGVKLYVFDLKGGGSRDDVQKIKVTLEPLFTKEQLLDILKENNPKFLNYVKQHAFYANTKGSDKENLDDGVE